VPLGAAQHRNDLALLGRPFHVGLRFRLRQYLDRRPRLIDQRRAITDLPPLLDTGQSVPQRQQPLRAQWGGVQFLL
jgi:hypothetical protein